MQNVLDSLYKDVQQAHAVGILGQNDVLKVKLRKTHLPVRKLNWKTYFPVQNGFSQGSWKKGGFTGWI
jgi:hypothetical protein